VHGITLSVLARFLRLSDNVIIPNKEAPDFAWIIASRVCDKSRSSDAIIFITGKRGSGKSVLTLGLAEELSKHIATIRGGKPEDYFTIDNLKTVDKTGGLSIMSSDALLRQNNILILDDAQISLSARRSSTRENNAVNDLVCICRPFNSVILINSVYHRNIDRGSRSLADYIISVQYSNPFTQQTVCKVYTYSENSRGDELKKFLTWTDKDGHKKRLKFFVSTLPSKDLLAAYNTKRKENSVKLVEQCREDYLSGDTNGQKRAITRKNRVEEIVQVNREKALQLQDQGKSMRAIARELNLTDYQTNKCLSKG
jgi:hypothetical protein